LQPLGARQDNKPLITETKACHVPTNTWYLLIFLSRYWTRRQRMDLFGLLPHVTKSLITQR